MRQGSRGPTPTSPHALRLLVLAAAAVLAASLVPAVRADPPPVPPRSAVATPTPSSEVPGELIVRFKRGTRAAERAAVVHGEGARLVGDLPVAGLSVVRSNGASTSALEARVERDPSVLYAEPNRYRSAFVTPDDTYFTRLWGLNNTGQTVAGFTGSPDADIDGPEAWDLGTGDPAVSVAVVDSGIDRTHPDLAPNLWANPGETGGGRETNGIDDDGDGYVDDTSGWDFVGNDGDPTDANGHGTHVSGTIGARGGNGAGVTGVAWNASLMPLRVLDATGNGTVADVIDAYAYAGAKGARVVSASFGGTAYSQAERDAIAALPNVLFVVAAGNSGTNDDSLPEYPCSYPLSNIVCVAASDEKDALATFSSYGAQSVDLAAPGTHILSTWPGGGYAYLNGTSMATPHVSGVAALAFSRSPGATPQTVKAALLAGVDTRPALAGKTVSGGRLNALQTLTGRLAAAPAAPAPAPARDTTAPRLALHVPRRERLRKVLRKGVTIRVECSETCSLNARALLREVTSKRLGVIASGSLAVLGKDSTRLSASVHGKLVIRLSHRAKRLLRHMRRAKLRLRIRATDLAGNTREVHRSVRVRRR